MKNILKISLLIALVVTLFTGCEKDRTKYEYDGAAFIHIGKRSYQIAENTAGILEIPVYITHPQTTQVSVDYLLEVSTNPKTVPVEGVDYIDLSGFSSPLEFEVGETKKVFKFQIVDNLSSGDSTFTELNLTLTGNSAQIALGFPGPDALNSEANIRFIEDDCPFNHNDLAVMDGRELTDWWDQTDTYTWAFVDSVGSQVSFDVTGILKPQLDNWGETVSSGGIVRVILDFATKEVIVPEQYWGSSTDGSGSWDYWVSSINHKQGHGTFNPCSREIILHYTLAFDADYTVSSWAHYPVTFYY